MTDRTTSRAWAPSTVVYQPKYEEAAGGIEPPYGALQAPA